MPLTMLAQVKTFGWFFKPKLHILPSGGRVPEFSTPAVFVLFPCPTEAAGSVLCLLWWFLYILSAALPSVSPKHMLLFDKNWLYMKCEYNHIKYQQIWQYFLLLLLQNIMLQNLRQLDWGQEWTNYWQTFSRRATSSGLPLNSAVEVFKAVGLSGFDKSSGGISFPSFRRFT